MNNRLMKVFYGEDSLPYKDSERSVHYPIVGSAFLNSSNVAQIRFYVDLIGGTTKQWVVIGKLPNGKRIFQPIETYGSDEEGTYYIFNITSKFTQAKGDLFLSLGGYLGDAQVDDDTIIFDENLIVETTGAIKINIAYATPIAEGEEDIETLAQVLGALGRKVDKTDEVKRLYGTTFDGEQTTLNYDITINANFIPQRDNYGRLKTPNPSDANDCANKYYVDDVIADLDLEKLNRVQITNMGTTSLLDLITNYGESMVLEIRDTMYSVNENAIISFKENVHNVNYTITMIFLDAQYFRKADSYVITGKSLWDFFGSTTSNSFLATKRNATITANYTYSTLPQSGVTPTNDNDLVRKGYVDTRDSVLQGAIDTINNTTIPLLIPKSEKGIVDGVATLDSNGKIPLTQLPDSILGQVEYCGNWNANSSTDQTIRTPRKGDYYICQTGGVYNPDGTSTGADYELGDWAIYDGSAWEKIDNTDAVQSVNGQTGAVVLYATSINLTSDVDSPTIYDSLADKLDISVALDTYQAKILHADLLNIPTSSWVKDTSVTPNVWRYTSGDLYASLGLVSADDLAEIVGINGETRNEIAQSGIYLDDIETTNGETYAYLCSSYQPTENLNISVVVTKQYANGGSVESVITVNDIDTDTLEIVNNKLGVKSSLVSTWNGKQNKLYKHNITLKNSNVADVYKGVIVFSIINNVSTAYTTVGQVANVINLKGFTSYPNILQATGYEYDVANTKTRVAFGVYASSGSEIYYCVSTDTDTVLFGATFNSIHDIVEDL